MSTSAELWIKILLIESKADKSFTHVDIRTMEIVDMTLPLERCVRAIPHAWKDHVPQSEFRYYIPSKTLPIETALSNDLLARLLEMGCTLEQRGSFEPLSILFQEQGRTQSDIIHLLITRPEDEYFVHEVNGTLPDARHTEFYNLLALSVLSFRTWTYNDVIHNGGSVIDEDASPMTIDSSIKRLLSILERKRKYKLTGCERLVEEAKNVLDEQFPVNFQLVGEDEMDVMTEPHELAQPNEFIAFMHVRRCFVELASAAAKKGKSSAVRNSIFTGLIMLPPAFAYEEMHKFMRYNQGIRWEFPIYVRQAGAVHSLENARSFRPKNGFALCTTPPSPVDASIPTIPFIIGEVDSNNSGVDRQRMLSEAIVAVRIGKFCMRPGSEYPYVLMAVYVTAQFVAERYLVTQAKDGTVQFILRKFNLQSPLEAYNFLRQVYNFFSHIVKLHSQLDSDRSSNLNNANVYAKRMSSLSFERSSSHSRQSADTVGSASASRMWTIRDEEGQEDDDQVYHGSHGRGLFSDPKLQEELKNANFDFGPISGIYPHIALVTRKDDPRTTVILKFIKGSRSGKVAKEIGILEYLSGRKEDGNHTIHLNFVWKLAEGATVIAMPFYRVILEYLEMDMLKGAVDAFNLAEQLAEGLEFMHKMGIAHRDVKPKNIVVDRDTLRLYIIDFSLSIRVDCVDHKCDGFVGTEGWAAPEVGREPYSPIYADLWSCGKVFRTIGGHWSLSHCCDHLVKVSELLMNHDPHLRPGMAEAVGMIHNHKCPTLSRVQIGS